MNKDVIVNNLCAINYTLDEVKDIDLRIKIRSNLLNILDALELERPHILTEEELLRYEAGDYVWGETEDHRLFYLELCEKPYKNKKGRVEFFFYPNEAFAKTTWKSVKLWSGMPTMEERKAVKWDGIRTD